MSFTSSEKERVSLSKVKGLFTRSKPTSRATTPVPGDDKGPAPTNEGRFEWQVDESSIAELKAWFDEHGDTTWVKFAEKVDGALQSKRVDVLRNLIPDGPVPVKSLADGLFSLVELVVQIPGAKQNAYEITLQAIKDVNDLVEVFRTAPSNFLVDSWNDFKSVRDAVNGICKCANVQVRKPVPNIEEMKNRKEELNGKLQHFQRITTARIKADADAERQLDKIDKEFANRVASRVRYEEQNKIFCAQNTRARILEELERWATEVADDHRICWISGIAGSGKSTIASTIAHRLRANNVLCAQYFVSRNIAETTEPQRLFPTIAQELAHFSPLAAQVIHTAMKTGAHAGPVDAQLAKVLVVDPVQKISQQCGTGTVVIVIDAVDEFQSAVTGNVPLILSGIASQLPANAKFIITSRPDQEIILAINAPKCKRIQLKADDSVEDVTAFIRAELTRMKPADCKTWPTDDQVRILSDKADGLFQYAQTAIEWIRGQIAANEMSREDVFDDIQRWGVEGKVDELYYHIVNRWGNIGIDEKAKGGRKHKQDQNQSKRLERFRQIVGLLVVLRQPFCIRDLIELLKINDFGVTQFFEQMRSVLIPGTDSSIQDVIPRMHKSFRDYICRDDLPDDLLEDFRINENQAHLFAAQVCLRVVVEAPDSRLVFDYACKQWWRHLEQACGSELGQDKEISHLLEELHKTSVFAAWWIKIYIWDAFGVLAKIGWTRIKEFADDDWSKHLNKILAQLKEQQQIQIQIAQQQAIQMTTQIQQQQQQQQQQMMMMKMKMMEEYSGVPMLDIWHVGLIGAYQHYLVQLYPAIQHA